MSADPIRINGNQFSWGSIILTCGGQQYNGFTSISYGDKRERVKAYGMGRHQAPRGRSRGKYTTEPVKLGAWTGSAELFREVLAALSGNGLSYGDVECQVLVQYVDTGEKSMTVEIERCVYVSTSTSNEEGAELLKEEVELDCMYIRRNGLTLFDSTQGNP